MYFHGPLYAIDVVRIAACEGIDFGAGWRLQNEQFADRSFAIGCTKVPAMVTLTPC
jgi:hypothetical protein